MCRGGMLFGTSAVLTHAGLQRVRRTSTSNAAVAVAVAAGSVTCRVAVCPTAGGSDTVQQCATFSIPKPSIWLWYCPPSGTASPTIRTEERSSACLCRCLASPAAQAPPRYSLSRPRIETQERTLRRHSNFTAAGPHPPAVWHGILAMWPLSEGGRRFERGQAVDAGAQRRPHRAGDVARIEWCGLVRRSQPGVFRSAA